jgi:hypothetical protein
MSIFKGSLSSRLQQHHLFFSEDKFLVNININSFTKSSCHIIYNQNRKLLNNSIFNNLPQSISSTQTILDLGTNLVCQYTAFNLETKEFNQIKSSISLSDLYALVNYHENRIFNSNNIPQDQSKDLQIQSINNSLEKSVVCKFSLYNYGIFNINLIFQERGNRSNERSVAFQGLQIAAPPRSATGQTWGFANTNNHQKSSVGNIGTFLAPTNSRVNNNNLLSKQNNGFNQDSVAGNLDMYYDNNTGKWKAGNTQILARLLEDIPPAPLESLESVDLENTPINEILPISTQFTTGKAMPLSMQNGNPYTYGPTFVECLVRNKVEVTVTNRSLKSFKKDEVVMLTEINGEWIPQSFGEDQKLASTIKFEDWAFFKYIANTDSYFKDKKYYDRGEDQYLTDIKPTIYETVSRSRFYSNILISWSNTKRFIEDNIERPSLFTIYGSKLQVMAQLNNVYSINNTFEPSTNFYISSIFDQITDVAGGYIPISILNYTNASDTTAFNDPSDIAGLFYKPRKFKTFWGPTYQDGFKTFEYNPNGKDNTNTFQNFFKELPQSTINDTDKTRYILNPNNNNNINGRLLNMPAECGGRFINPKSIFQSWSSLGTSDFLINNQYVHSLYYGTSEPINKNKIQFSPLYAEMIAESNSQILNRQNGLRAEFGLQPADSIVGNLFQRSAFFGSQLASQEEIENNSAKVLIENNVKRTPNSLGGNAIRSYVPWENSLGVTTYQGAFCVGVISSKQTISKRGGGNINFSTNQTFGRNTFNRIGGGTQTGVTILGLGVGMTAVGFSNQLAPASSSPTWGSRTDNISSFGTTALHVRIFDYWPEEQTSFDPRYFGVLHFNAGSYYNQGVLFRVENESQENLQKRINNAKTLDIPIPTLDLPEDPNNPDPFQERFDIVSENDIVNNIGIVRSGEAIPLKPKTQWKLNPIRRGALLTAGGFIYLYHVIGVNHSSIFRGTGFNKDFEYSIPSKNLIFNFTVKNGQINSWTYKKDSLGNELRGDNFLPQDFNSSNIPTFDNQGNITGYDQNERAYIVTIPSQTPNGKSAIIMFTNGIVWLKMAKDEAPKEQKGITRLTKGSLSSNTGIVSGGQDTVITLEKNTTGKYDCFYHFHNDISHTLSYEYSAMPSWLQYVNLTIT